MKKKMQILLKKHNNQATFKEKLSSNLNKSLK
jgi:hypothetical protein